MHRAPGSKYEIHLAGVKVSVIPGVQNFFRAQEALSSDQSRAEVYILTILNLTEINMVWSLTLLFDFGC